MLALALPIAGVQVGQDADGRGRHDHGRPRLTDGARQRWRSGTLYFFAVVVFAFGTLLRARSARLAGAWVRGDHAQVERSIQRGSGARRGPHAHRVGAVLAGAPAARADAPAGRTSSAARGVVRASFRSRGSCRSSPSSCCARACRRCGAHARDRRDDRDRERGQRDAVLGARVRQPGSTGARRGGLVAREHDQPLAHAASCLFLLALKGLRLDPVALASRSARSGRAQAPGVRSASPIGSRPRSSFGVFARGRCSWAASARCRWRRTRSRSTSRR